MRTRHALAPRVKKSQCQRRIKTGRGARQELGSFDHGRFGLAQRAEVIR